MSKRIRISLLFLCSFIASGATGMGVPRFRNYRLSAGAGLGYSPVMLLNPAPFHYKPWQAAKPSLKLEYSLTGRYSLNFGMQGEYYSFQTRPLIGYERLYQNNTDYAQVNTGVKSTLIAFTADLRKYSTQSGYIAPFGRYIMYGCSFNYGRFRVSSFDFSFEDEFNKHVQVEVPAARFRSGPDIGIRFGVGKKRYNGKKLKTFWEYQMICDLKIGDFGSGLDENTMAVYGGSRRVAYENTMRISQTNSLLQFNITYGFSL